MTGQSTTTRTTSKEKAMTVHKTWVVIYSSDPMVNLDLATRLQGLEWWITNRENYEETRGVTKMIDLTELKD
jgi:hypothetical protein